MKKKERPLSELTQIMEPFPQVLKNVRVTRKIALDQISGFSKKLTTIEESLGTTGRILIRPSGTEPVIRVMIEGEDEKLIDDMACELCDFITKHAG